MTSACNRVGLLLTFLALGCSAAQKLGHDKPNANPFAWVVGDWEGYRIDGESGSRSPLSSKIIFILGGAAVCEDLTVGGGAAPYRGFYVQGPGPNQGQWQMHYISEGRKSALYKGAVTDSSAEWFSTKISATRKSRLYYERLANDHWRRTMFVSDDLGETWEELWRDEMH